MKNHFWATKYHREELWAAGSYPNQCKGGDGLEKWSEQDRSIDGEVRGSIISTFAIYVFEYEYVSLIYLNIYIYIYIYTHTHILLFFLLLTCIVHSGCCCVDYNGRQSCGTVGGLADHARPPSELQDAALWLL